MPALSALVDSEKLARRVAEVGAHVLVRREVSHFTVETIAVVITIFVSMGVLMWWGITNGGAWKK